jgi:ABC-type sugar transport system ATPase subunit
VAFGEPVLVAKGISKFFPGVVALDNVDFEIRAAKSMPCSAKTEPENRRSSR